MSLKDALDNLMSAAREAENKESNEPDPQEVLKHFFVCMNEDVDKERAIPSIGFGALQILIAEAYVHLELVSRIGDVLMGPFGPNHNAKIEVIGASQLSMLRKALNTRIREIVKELVEKYQILEVVSPEQFRDNMQALRKAGLW